ncbi:hypothetical protein IU501_11020 [Nocardia otitidiscaviarum]|uniref:hypothetical protein n=1 Tax=Nocardia otitidiscaviarum TaxID=1823 RepID=UPI0018956DC5|nr:hypothetical protein [Nocardia otitidiscaviarum]MBF6133531.1 hypothetical protein [Nocardia otitidiscaviarum]
MELLAIMLIVVMLLAAIAAVSRPPRRRGPSVADIQARLAAERAHAYAPIGGRR